MNSPAYRVLEARSLGPDVVSFRVDAPMVARHLRAGQFVIVRVARGGERIPLTVAAVDREVGWIQLVVQGVGKTTKMLNQLQPGDSIADVAGPLGRATEIENFGHVVVVGGGVGTAIAYPAAAALADAGNRVTAIVGGRTEDLVLFEPELRSFCHTGTVTTDDGSYGRRGIVTEPLTEIIESDDPPDRILTAGPVPMMRAVAEASRSHAIPTIASLNPIMVDGTGMCGGCRVAVGGETRFACVDGPEFDAHAVDFELLDRRNRAYRAFEEARSDEVTSATPCRLDTEVATR